MWWRRTARVDGLRLALLGLLAVALMPGRATAQPVDPAAVVDAYQAARARGDVDALAALFADDAVVSDPFGSSHAGKAEVRQWLGVVAARPRTVGLERASVTADGASWFEQVGTGTGSPGFAVTVEAVMTGGRIVSLVYRRADTPESAPPADTRAPLPAPLGLAAVLLLLSLALVSFRAFRPLAPSSRERLLLASLQKWTDERRRT